MWIIQGTSNPNYSCRMQLHFAMQNTNQYALPSALPRKPVASRIVNLELKKLHFRSPEFLIISYC